MKIGLTYTGSDAKHENYVRWIKGTMSGADGGVGTGGAERTGEEAVKGGEEIVVIRLSAGDNNFEEIRNCDGLVLSGGVDIEPGVYGGSSAYVKAPSKGWEKDRDLFEQSVLQFAWENGLPVLGVCRGLQLINVSRQGTLVQDLGQQGDEVHENVMGVDKEHSVKIVRDSLLGAIAGQEEGVVNSAHHQAIECLGEGLTVNSRAADGTIEGIEWTDPVGKPFMIAVQWHPERMYTNALPDVSLYKKLRDQFVEAVRESMGKKA